MTKRSRQIDEAAERAFEKIIEYKKAIDGIVERAQKRRTRAERDLNETALKIELEDIRDEAEAARYTAEVGARVAVEMDFDEIEAAVNAWAVEPIDTVFLNLAQAHNSFGLALTLEEMKTLSAKAAGSYYAQKILSGLATAQGLYFPFVELADIKRTIRGAKSECMTVIDHYSGIIENNAAAGAWVFDGITAHWAAIAERFGEYEGGRFSEMTETIDQLISGDYSLLPNDRERIAELFDGAQDEEQRLERMARLMNSSPELESRLIVYDAELYQKAAEQARAEALERNNANRAAQAEATQGIFDSAKEAAAADRKIRAAKNARGGSMRNGGLSQ